MFEMYNLINFDIPNSVLWELFWDLKIDKITFQKDIYTVNPLFK